MKAQSLLLFMLLLPCLTSGLYKISPPSSTQHTDSLCTFLFLLFSTPLFKAAVFLEFPWGKSSTWKGFLITLLRLAHRKLSHSAHSAFTTLLCNPKFSHTHTVCSHLGINPFTLQKCRWIFISMCELCLEMWVIVHILNTNCSKYIRAALHHCQSDLSDKQNLYHVKT